MGMETTSSPGAAAVADRNHPTSVLESTSSLSPWREESVSCVHSFSRERDRQSDSESGSESDRKREGREADKGTSSKLFLKVQIAGTRRRHVF